MDSANILKWKIELEKERQEKNKFFILNPRSPLPESLRTGFKGLSHYPLDFNFHFELKLFKHKEKLKIKVKDSNGKDRQFLKWGQFRFRVANTNCVLQVYKSDYSEETLFIPFRDETCGKETYVAGRYIDLEPKRHKRERGKWILDFNQSYNPFCAYNSTYACPFVPPENWLKVAVRAGEKSINRVVFD